MYDVNGAPSTSTSTRCCASCRTNSTRGPPAFAAWALPAANGAASKATKTNTSEMAGHLVVRAIDMLGMRIGSPEMTGGMLAGKHAAHVGQRLFHAGQRIIGIDFVLEVHVSWISHRFELVEQLGNRQHSLTDNALAFLRVGVAEVLGMDVEKARSGVGGRLDDVGAGARCVTDVHAETDARIQVPHPIEHVVRRREVFVFRSVIVNRDLDVV